MRDHCQPSMSTERAGVQLSLQVLAKSLVESNDGVRANESPGPGHQVASWNTRPSVCRMPERTVLTPWRIGALDHPHLVATGRSCVVDTSP